MIAATSYHQPSQDARVLPVTPSLEKLDLSPWLSPTRSMQETNLTASGQNYDADDYLETSLHIELTIQDLVKLNTGLIRCGGLATFNYPSPYREQLETLTTQSASTPEH
ncbi:hypothetical protein BC939DRAFT_501476 [Gamsiella multidivaricata]|uniref:uncharacterized protein n=1 Tax=Gamsiella multidivaricata TaxID=101098 RepID=UPI00221EB7AF|nr:uncharacterized protein BC939DRAFT_501476 [Gamsiella multidivaricata]KAI7827145.1 hypothetical protein BC939DRAFT_501476 [Gamsiella multidivaricata]